MTLSVDKPVLVLIRGLPGSGKSFLTRELERRLPADVLVVLDPDAIDFNSSEYAAHREALSREGVDEKLHPYRFLRAQAYRGIAEHKIIIWNQPFTNLEIFHKMLANMHLQAEEHQVKLEVLVVEVEVDPDTAKQRVDSRKQAGGHGPSDTTFERFKADYESFADQGLRTVRVQGGGDVVQSAEKVMAELQALGGGV